MEEKKRVLRIKVKVWVSMKEKICNFVGQMEKGNIKEAQRKKNNEKPQIKRKSNNNK